MSLVVVADSAPPSSVWHPPSDVTRTVMVWLGYLSYVGLAVSALAVIVLGALLVLDRDRGEPVSARAVHVALLRIALGVMVMSAAGSLAGFFA